MGTSAEAVEVLRKLLHGVLLREDITFADRQTLEHIDAAAGTLSARYRCLSASPATMMHYLVRELRALTVDARETLAKDVVTYRSRQVHIRGRWSGDELASPGLIPVLRPGGYSRILVVQNKYGLRFSTEYIDFTFTDARGLRWRRVEVNSPS